MARYGSDGYDDDEPTQLSGYGGDGTGAPPNNPWYRKPAALVALGALGAVLVALVVYGLARAITGGTPPEPGPTTSLTPLTTAATAPGSEIGPLPTRTGASTTDTRTPTTTTPSTTPTTTPSTTTTTPTTTTTQPPSTSVSTSTSTVTQTQTETQTVTQPPAAAATP